jgi:UDPglucose 6-dehydrogenase
MKVTVIGTGYVGLVTGACLAEMGNHVVCLDVDARKIRSSTRRHPDPRAGPGRRSCSATPRRAACSSPPTWPATAHGTLQFIGVGTPPDEDGSADLQYVLAPPATSAAT